MDLPALPQDGTPKDFIVDWVKNQRLDAGPEQPMPPQIFLLRAGQPVMTLGHESRPDYVVAFATLLIPMLESDGFAVCLDGSITAAKTNPRTGEPFESPEEIAEMVNDSRYEGDLEHGYTHCISVLRATRSDPSSILILPYRWVGTLDIQWGELIEGSGEVQGPGMDELKDAFTATTTAAQNALMRAFEDHPRVTAALANLTDGSAAITDLFALLRTEGLIVNEHEGPCPVCGGNMPLTTGRCPHCAIARLTRDLGLHEGP